MRATFYYSNPVNVSAIWTLELPRSLVQSQSMKILISSPTGSIFIRRQSTCIVFQWCPVTIWLDPSKNRHFSKQFDRTTSSIHSSVRNVTQQSYITEAQFREMLQQPAQQILWHLWNKYASKNSSTTLNNCTNLSNIHIMSERLPCHRLQDINLWCPVSHISIGSSNLHAILAQQISAHTWQIGSSAQFAFEIGSSALLSNITCKIKFSASKFSNVVVTVSDSNV